MNTRQESLWPSAHSTMTVPSPEEPEPPFAFTPRIFPALSWAATDAILGLPSDAQLRQLATRMDRLHKNKSETVSQSTEIRAIGLAGERHVARCLGIPMDTRLKPYGSQRNNLRLGNVTIDAVTRTMPRNGAEPDIILKTTSRPHPGHHAMALVVWHGWEYEPQLAGWIWESTLRATGIITEYRPGHPNYAIPASELLPLASLLDTMPTLPE